MKKPLFILFDFLPFSLYLAGFLAVSHFTSLWVAVGVTLMILGLCMKLTFLLTPTKRLSRNI
jgi:hypothetical protein